MKNEAQPEVEPQTAGAAPILTEIETSKGPKVTGLTGELALQKMGKNARKKMLEEQKREEMEKQALKERIQKANIEREAQRLKAQQDAQKA